MVALHILGYLLLAFGVYVCAFNFVVNLALPFWHRHRGTRCPYFSPAPLLGSFIVVALAFLLPLPAVVFWLLIAIALLDTGGIHMFAFSMLWHYFRPPGDTSTNDRNA